MVDGFGVNLNALNGLSEIQCQLLADLVRIARQPSFDAAEPFLAVRIGLAGVTILHADASSVSVSDMIDVETLERHGFIELRRLPSGTRCFQITDEGFRRVETGEASDSNSEHVAAG